MNRRHFLFSAGGLLACAASSPTVRAEPSDHWWPEIKEADRFTARAADGKLRLVVELLSPSEEQVEQRTSKDGEVTAYYFRGKRLPEGYRPFRSVLTRFDFFWGHRQMEIPRRLWADLCHLRIQTIELDQSKFTPAEKDQFGRFVAALDQPRVFLSADGGTALIEWGRPEECDNHSTIRWIVSRNGTVLRHTLTPPDEC